MIEFPPYRVDLDEERVWRGAELLALRRKPFAILRYLVMHPNKLVTHDELLAEVWHGTAVSDSAVRSHLHELRSVLGDGVIETVIGRGYRFIAELATPATRPRPRAGIDRWVVGRDAELANLRAALARAETGHRQVCFVTGDPGIGKTTLVDTFLDEVTARGRVVARGQCIEQFGAPEAYLALIEAARALPNGPALVAAIERGGPHISREITSALEHAAATETIVLAIEDMQWSDLATLDLLASLGQRKERARLLVIITARRGDVGVAEHPMNHVMRTLVTRSGAHAITLSRIDASQIERYVASRFAGHAFPAGLVTIVDRITEGTPLFMVSLLDDLVRRSMVREEADGWRLDASLEDVAAVRPDGVRQLIDVQLDRLEPDEQRVLEAASMVGIQFASALVAAALDRPIEPVEEILELLVKRGLFVRRETSEDWPDGTVQPRYRVTHGLVQEVASSRVSLARKQRWNRAIADRLETAWGPRAGEIAHVLAVHFDHGQAPSRAVAHYIAAGQRDARRFAVPDSLRMFGRARELIGRSPPSAERDRHALTILQGLASSVLRTADHGMRDPMALFEEMTELAHRIEDKPALVAALANVVMRLCTLSEYARAANVMAQVDHLLESVEISDELRGFVEVARGLMLYWRGDLAAAVPSLEATARKRGAIDHAKFGLVSPTDQATIMHVYLGYLYWILGDDARFRREAHAVVEAARATADPYGVGVALAALSRMHAILGDSPEDIRRPAREVLTLRGAEPVIPVAQLMLGCAQRREQPLDAEAASSMLSAFRTRAEMYPMGKTVLALLVVDGLRGSRDNETLALALVDEMIAFARERDERLGESELVRTRGELLEAIDSDADPDAALAAYEEAARIAETAGALGSLARARARLDSRRRRG